MRLSPLVLAAACCAPASHAQQAAAAASPERDAAAVYIAQGNFIITRLATECLPVLRRAESPRAYASAWQQRNARYLAAQEKYIAQRASEAGARQAEALRQAFRQAVQDNGEASVQALLQGRREEGCMHGITLVDTGALDISSKLPQFEQLEALVRWAAQ